MLTDEERGRRSRSFGAAAEQYDRYRPSPPRELLESFFDCDARSVIDLGAGTGVTTAALVELFDDVTAVEPDDAMRAVLLERIPGVNAVKGTGEKMPLPDSSADALVAGTSWHWVEPTEGLKEVARVLKPGGTFAAFWVGIDPDGAFLALATRALNENSQQEPGEEPLGDVIIEPGRQVDPTLRIPEESGFSQPEQKVVTWVVALTADELLGLLGTFSWIILMEDERREALFKIARATLQMLGIEGGVTVDVDYRADGFKARRL